MADYLCSNGVTPLSPATGGSADATSIGEVKSVSLGMRHNRVRLGLGQLIDYSVSLRSPSGDVELVLVLEHEPARLITGDGSRFGWCPFDLPVEVARAPSEHRFYIVFSPPSVASADWQLRGRGGRDSSMSLYSSCRTVSPPPYSASGFWLSAAAQTAAGRSSAKRGPQPAVLNEVPVTVMASR